VFAAIGVTTLALAGAGVPELTLVQWRALVLVGRGEGLRVGEIAARTATSPPSMSRIVRRLERRGLVRTDQDVRDRRATLVSLTPEGQRVRGAVIATRHELLREALDRAPGKMPSDVPAGVAAIADALEAYG
jgi:DNA-binding MarR family transcriptional regulator